MDMLSLFKGKIISEIYGIMKKRLFFFDNCYLLFLKRIRNLYGNYCTLSSVIKNTHLTSEYSLFYFIVLKDSSPNSKISNSSSQITNIYNNYSDLSPKAKKEGFNMNNKKDPNEQIAFKLFNAKLLDENKFNILRQLIAEQNDEILELFKLYMNHGNNLKNIYSN